MKLFFYLILSLVVSLSTSVEAQTKAESPVKTEQIDTFSHGYFSCSFIYQPTGRLRGVALLLTKHQALATAQEDHCNVNNVSALNDQETKIAQTLRNNGVLVAVLDINKVLREQEDDNCTNIDGDLDNFSRVMQARYQLPGYQTPILVGVDQMAGWVYSRLASAEPKTYNGGISVNFSDKLALRQPLCQGRVLSMEPPTYNDKSPVTTSKKPEAKKLINYRLLPSNRLGTPWVVIPNQITTAANEEKVKTFVGKVADASFYENNAQSNDTTEALVLKAFNQLAPREVVVPQPPAVVADLPIIEMPSKAPVKKNNDVLAIMLSGDGGWAGIDKDLAGEINKNGISVIGFDSLRYFWKARTPDSTAKDVARLIQYYQSQPNWKRSKVLLIGYSQGADVLPFVVNRLPQDVKKQLISVALLSLGKKADFEFHVSNWISSSNDGLPILPEVKKLPAGLAFCVYGDSDEDALCPTLDPTKVNVGMLKLPGDHHFNGAYSLLARQILYHLQLTAD